MGRDNQGGAASAICARATRIGNSTMKSSKEDQALRQRALPVLQPRAVCIGNGVPACVAALGMLGLTTDKQQCQRRQRGFSNFRTRALLHAASRMNPLCTAALYCSVEYGRLERVHRPTNLEKRLAVSWKEPRQRSIVSLLTRCRPQTNGCGTGRRQNLPLCSVFKGSGVLGGEVGPNGRTVGMLTASPTGLQRIHSLSPSHQRSDSNKICQSAYEVLGHNASGTLIYMKTVLKTIEIATEGY